jgi:hypothetical protein
LFSATLASAQDKKKKTKTQIVEASPWTMSGMEGHGCELAVRIDGKSYFVDGSIDPMVMRMPKMVLCCHKKSRSGW